MLVDNWSTGRVALLGDAAHPVLRDLAQGACQALEDGAALADALAKTTATAHPCTEDVTGAFGECQASRVEQATSVQRTARVWRDSWHVDGLSMALRDESFRLRPIHDFRHIDWLYGATRPASRAPHAA